MIHITITWEAVGALAVAGGALAAVAVWFVRSVVRDELEIMSARFVPSMGAPITGADIQRRLDHLEAM